MPYDDGRGLRPADGPWGPDYRSNSNRQVTRAHRRRCHAHGDRGGVPGLAEPVDGDEQPTDTDARFASPGSSSPAARGKRRDDHVAQLAGGRLVALALVRYRPERASRAPKGRAVGDVMGDGVIPREAV